MMRTWLTLIISFIASNLSAQTSYTGFIDKFPIDLVTNIYSDGVANAIYAYQKFDEPIIINGRLEKSVLTLLEKNGKGKNVSMFTFENFDVKSNTIVGTWANLKTLKEFKVILNKDFDVAYGEDVEWNNREIIQPVSLKDQYFKLLISKNKDDFYARVTGIKIIEKKKDSLIQKIDMDCQLLGLDNIFVGDFNFDGLPDFSVFESSYAGPNTSSLYFLYNPATKKYFNSGFSGVSLAFDNKKKTISEHNQCCAGSQHTTAIYKVVNNKMVLIEQHCYKWDEEKEELVERKMSECQ